MSFKYVVQYGMGQIFISCLNLFRQGRMKLVVSDWSQIYVYPYKVSMNQSIEPRKDIT